MVVISGGVIAVALIVVRALYQDFERWEREHPESADTMKEAVGWLIGGVIIGALGLAIIAFVYDTRDAAGWTVLGILSSVVGLVSGVVGLIKKSAVH